MAQLLHFSIHLPTHKLHFCICLLSYLACRLVPNNTLSFAKYTDTVDQVKTALTDASEFPIVDGEDYATLVTCVAVGVNSHRLLARWKGPE